MSKPLTKYQHSSPNNGVYTATILSDGTFAAAGYDRKVKRFSYRSYWTGASAITATTSPMQCCSSQVSTPGPGFYMSQCEVGTPSNPGICIHHSLYVFFLFVFPSLTHHSRIHYNSVAYKSQGRNGGSRPCSPVSPGNYVTQPCLAGNATTIGSDTVMSPCSQPAEGEYVSSVCESGGLQRGSDTVMSPCSQPVEGEYVSSVCESGGLQRGSDTVMSPCSQPAEGEYVSSVCESGGAQLAGSDTEITPCPLVIEGENTYQQFYAHTCYTGDALTLGTPSIVRNCSLPIEDEYVVQSCEKGDVISSGGTDTVSVKCSTPEDGQYVKAACTSGGADGPGSNTVVANCSVPGSGTYTTSVCVQGDMHTVGKNTKIKECTKVVNPTTQVITTACQGGTSSTLGSNTVVGSACPIGTILRPVDNTFPCEPCLNNKWTSKAGREICDVCKVGYRRIEKGAMDFSCEKDDTSTTILDGSIAAGSTVGIAIGTVVGIAVLVAAILLVRARKRSAVSTVEKAG
jgi:hypothetical protein